VTERITGSVAQVLNARELVINRGEAHGVQVGMKFAVLNRKGADIVDPETDESLGPIEVEKTIVKVVRTHERMSVARTFRTFRTSGLTLPDFFAARAVRETLRTDEATYKAELAEEESYIKRGDPVVEFVGDEFDEENP
jgi:hypothetical protein